MRNYVVQLLGVCMMLFSAVASASAEEASAYEGVLGGVNIRVMALVEKDLKADILLPRSGEQKAAVAEAYPEGTVRNFLNVLLLRGRGVTALVDTGFEWTGKELDAALAQAGITRSDVTHVIVTHAHGDHIGGLVRDGAAAFPAADILFSAKELGHWTCADRRAFSGKASGIFDAVADIVRFYGERVRTFEPGADLFRELPGVQAVDESGHTPGHVGVMVRAEDGVFLFWSDVLHAFEVQTAHPSVSATFDMDAEEAARVREELLSRARAGGWLVVGSHVPFVQPRVLRTEGL